MKIVLLSSRFPPEGIGGTELACKAIAISLAHKGNNVHVITSDTIKSEIMENGFHVHRISYPRIPSLGVLYFWLAIPFFVRKIKPDIIHCQSTQIGLAAVLCKKIFCIPYVVWGQGSDIYLPWKFKKFINTIVLNNANSVIALTEDMKKTMQKISKRNIVALSNGVDVRSFSDVSKKTSREKLGVGPEKKIILFVGSLQAVKGLEYLLQAFAIIHGAVPESLLMIVGDGPESGKLKNIARSRGLEKDLQFVGKVAHDSIPRYMAAADVFVLPSLSEGFPLVILEAMASGLPIVATRIRGIPEIITDGKNGFLVEPKNPGALAQKIIEVLSSDTVRRAMGDANKEKAQRYSWDAIAQELLAIYSQSLNS